MLSTINGRSALPRLCSYSFPCCWFGSSCSPGCGGKKRRLASKCHSACSDDHCRSGAVFSRFDQGKRRFPLKSRFVAWADEQCQSDAVFSRCDQRKRRFASQRRVACAGENCWPASDFCGRDYSLAVSSGGRTLRFKCCACVHTVRVFIFPAKFPSNVASCRVTINCISTDPPMLIHPAVHLAYSGCFRVMENDVSRVAV